MQVKSKNDKSPAVVLFLSKSIPWDIMRQAPGGQSRWNQTLFVTDHSNTNPDCCAVFEDLACPVHISVPRARTLLITGEPPEVKQYDPQYVQQFGGVITCHNFPYHKNVIHSQQGLPWMIGMEFDSVSRSWNEGKVGTFDKFASSVFPQKQQLLSVIISKKSTTKDHIRRERFLEYASKHLGSDLKVYGVGHNPVVDKWDVISASRFHVVIENSHRTDYWTEKLSDAFIGWAYPLYSGCTNLNDYFGSGSFSGITIKDPQKGVDDLCRIIERMDGQDLRSSIQLARNLVLNRYNLLDVIARYCARPLGRETYDPVTLYPQSHFRRPWFRHLLPSGSSIGRWFGYDNW